MRELLTGFLPRKSMHRLRADPARTLAVRAADAGTEWLVRIGPDGADAASTAAAADCAIRGAAADLYLLLWNRRESLDGIEVTGDSRLLTQLREQFQV